jgi:hypothetical protein
MIRHGVTPRKGRLNNSTNICSWPLLAPTWLTTMANAGDWCDIALSTLDGPACCGTTRSALAFQLGLIEMER